jgi:hypothetical protein
MASFSGISIFETLLLTLGDKSLDGERRMFEDAFAGAVSMLVFFFGASVAFIVLSGYLWSRVRKRILLE